MTELEIAGDKLKKAISDYNAAYPSARLGGYSMKSFDLASARFDRRLGGFTKTTREEIEKTKQVPVLAVDMLAHLRDNGFLAPALEALINKEKD